MKPDAQLIAIDGDDKTKATVTFDDKLQHKCRLSFACNGKGFIQHCFRGLAGQILRKKQKNKHQKSMV
ncbi:TPA: hypothetical protein ACVU4S_004206 [Vibrio parahaemolyticus]